VRLIELADRRAQIEVHRERARADLRRGKPSRYRVDRAIGDPGLARGLSSSLLAVDVTDEGARLARQRVVLDRDRVGRCLERLHRRQRRDALLAIEAEHQ